jgi:hypothetical protein
VGGGEPLEVEVRISPLAVPLEPLTIISERPHLAPNLRLETAGYYRRKETYGTRGLGVGHFLEREQIRDTNPARVSDVVRMIPGVLVEGAGSRRQVIRLRSSGIGGRCIPVVFVDGAPVATGRDIDELLSPWSLAAIEVYPGLVTAPEFMNAGDAPCGAVALWTGYGEPETSDARGVAGASRPAPAATTGPVTLDLLLPSDSAVLGDTLVVWLTVTNRSTDTASLCLTSSRYTLRGSGTDRAVLTDAGAEPCSQRVTLAPRASRSWQETIVFSVELDQPGAVLVQKHVRLRRLDCDEDDDECEVQLRTAPQQLIVHAAGGA